MIFVYYNGNEYPEIFIEATSETYSYISRKLISEECDVSLEVLRPPIVGIDKILASITFKILDESQKKLNVSISESHIEISGDKNSFYRLGKNIQDCFTGNNIETYAEFSYVYYEGGFDLNTHCCIYFNII